MGSGGSEISHVVSQTAGPKGPLLPIDLRAEGVDNERKVLYRKMHSQGRNDYMIEISKTKAKYYIVSVLMNRSRKVQILDFHLKQGKKLIRQCGGITNLADRVEFQHKTLTIRDM